MKKKAATHTLSRKASGRTVKATIIREALASCLNGDDHQAWRFAFSLCREEGEADELLQQTCFRVLLRSRLYDPSRPLRGWLLSIMRNEFVSMVRARRWRKFLSLDYSEEQEACFAREMVAGREETLDGLEKQEQAAMIRAILARLGKRHREVLTLCDMEGMSYRAAAKVLKINLGTLRSRLHRARSTMRRMTSSM